VQAAAGSWQQPRQVSHVVSHTACVFSLANVMESQWTAYSFMSPKCWHCSITSDLRPELWHAAAAVLWHAAAAVWHAAAVAKQEDMRIVCAA